MGFWVPGIFKLDHLQSFKPILIRWFSNFFTFILGSQFLLPQWANNENRGVHQKCSVDHLQSFYTSDFDFSSWCRCSDSILWMISRCCTSDGMARASLVFTKGSKVFYLRRSRAGLVLIRCLLLWFVKNGHVLLIFIRHRVLKCQESQNKPWTTRDN